MHGLLITVSSLFALGAYAEAGSQGIGTSLLSAMAPSAQDGATESAKPSPRKRSVLFYLMDTARADHLSMNGYDRPTTPFLESIAEKGVVFERCYSQAAWTKPAMAAILSSKYPSQVGIHLMFQQLSNSVTTFPEVLQANGWHTSGFSANPIMGAWSNYTQGFDQFVESIRVNRANPIKFASGSAQKLNDYVSSFLEESEHWPQFLYVHSVDPHEEYEPEMEFLELFADPTLLAQYRKQWKTLLATRPPVPGNHLTQSNFDAAGLEVAPFISYGMDLYDADICANDAGIQDLWDMLQDEGWGEDLILVLTADHGEEFFEHGATSHGYSLYDEMINVPLMIYAPGLLPAGLRIDRPVRSIDIYPTLLDLLDLEAPADLQGRSLVPLIEDPESWHDLPVISELTEDPGGRAGGSGAGIAMCVVQDPWKLHVHLKMPTNIERPRHELFNIIEDPGEMHNVAEQNPEVVARLDAFLMAWSAASLGMQAIAAEIDPEDLDPQVLEQLRGLGYTGGADDEESPFPSIAGRLPLLARAILEGAERLEIMSLHPYPDSPEGKPGRGKREDDFHGYKVMDSATLKDELRVDCIDKFYRGLLASNGRLAACFEPRHGLHASHKGHSADFVICLECMQVLVYVDGAESMTATISQATKRYFDAIYDEAGVEPRIK